MNTSRITGDATWKPCLNKAAALILDIYEYEDSKLTEEQLAAKREIPKFWEKDWTYDLTSGLFCAMYLPKMEGDLGPLDVCPPALVFRGSETQHEDIEEIAVTADINYVARVGGWEVASGRVPVPVISASEKISQLQTTEQVRASGMTEQLLIQPSAGRIALTLDAGWLADWNLEIDWNGSASLFFGNSGDWPTNMSQALGHFPKQYEQAIVAAKRAAQDAVNDWNGRLMIIGHSLGGGLASAAALAAKAKFPDLAVRSNVYNAAGLHQITAQQAQSRLSEASAAGISTNLIAGDVLTSAQTPGLIPLISDILRWGNVTLPPAIPSSAPSRGRSPGGTVMFDRGKAGGRQHPKKWDPLAILFPIDRQELVNGDLATIKGLFGIASSSPDFNAFADGTVRWLVRGLTGTDQSVNWQLLRDVWQAGFPMFVEAFRNAAPLIMQTAPLPDAAFPRVTIPGQNPQTRLAEQFFNSLLRDLIEFAQIMIRSVDYHMWDVCAHTFELDPP